MSQATMETPKHTDKKAKITQESFDETVTVKVGEERRVFLVHKNLLSNAANYFKAAFNGNFAEAQSQVLEMPEDGPEQFRWFVRWLYTDRVLQEGETLSESQFSILIPLYTFGEGRGIPDLQNEVIDVLVELEHSSKMIPTKLLNFVYEHTHRNSPLRRLFVDWLAYRATLDNGKWFAEEKESRYPKRCLMDITVVLYKIKTQERPKTRDFIASRSDYYVQSSESSATNSAGEENNIGGDLVASADT
ncbi:hypothetical protein ACLMJK_007011 [Lecanora helva]